MHKSLFLRSICAFFIAMFVLSCKSGGVSPSESEGALVSLTLSPENKYIARNTTFQMQAQGTFENGTTRTLTTEDNVAWSVDDTSISSINSNGVLTNTWSGGSTNATRILNVTATANNLLKTVQVTVVSATISSLIINPSDLTLAPGATVAFSIIANLSDGSTLDVTQSATASILNTAIASVNAGVITGGNEGVTTLEVSYSSRTATTSVTVSNGASSGGDTTGTGLVGDYYEGTNFDTFFGSRVDATVNFSWNADVNNLGQTENYSIRWTGFIKAEKTETYTFYTQADDGTRLSINGVPFASCINDWNVHATSERTCATTFSLTAGQKVAITLEYFEGPGVSVVRLLWSSPTTAKAIIPQEFLYPN